MATNAHVNSPEQYIYTVNITRSYISCLQLPVWVFNLIYVQSCWLWKHSKITESFCIVTYCMSML